MIFLLLWQLYSADPTAMHSQSADSFCRSESGITFVRSYLPGLRKTLIVAALLITTLLLPTDVHAVNTVVKVENCNGFERHIKARLGLEEIPFFCLLGNSNIYQYDVDKLSYPLSYPRRNFQNRHELKLWVIETVNIWNRIYSYPHSEHIESPDF